MFEATVEFTKNLTNVSIRDYVDGGKPLCKKKDGTVIENISASAKTTIIFLAEQFDGTMSGYVHITGTDGNIHVEKHADGIREGNPVKFP
ncbi:hypothetical protein ACI2KT_02345 [Ensifer adhaerens]|jgi:hypothetical protein|uniref:hypothetical protein n=1 Tax=Ensifer TaxID=106591 RepID=UPI000726AC6B|nr:MULTISPECIES: hypothetical protein [Ensifer]KSV76418.1 hypothetical protein N185_14775 [Sinorhizobium sp. GW3]OWZ91825.1 hypothetical protein B9J07_20370 [Sinorhizobium sp. LM21]MBD9492980.1 hypothetical protein [Ensifer sp. ENS01]MBD9595853.1 hypothetical protein [Ensifer sp. ENS05]UTV37095.1 hypothetical protein MYG64_01875 [Ensifer adhaerens]